MYSKSNGIIYSFSINGEKLGQDKDSSKDIVDVTIGRNSNFTDHLVYLNKKDNMLCAQKISDLEQRMNIVERRGTTVTIFDNQQMAVIGDESGEFTFLLNPYSLNSSQNKPLLIL